MFWVSSSLAITVSNPEPTRISHFYINVSLLWKIRLNFGQKFSIGIALGLSVVRYDWNFPYSRYLGTISGTPQHCNMECLLDPNQVVCKRHGGLPHRIQNAHRLLQNLEENT